MAEIESGYLEKRIGSIISISNDMLEGYAMVEQGCRMIIEIAEEVRGRWQCRFCKNWFPNSVAKENDYFGAKCLSCSARVELTKIGGKE